MLRRSGNMLCRVSLLQLSVFAILQNGCPIKELCQSRLCILPSVLDLGINLTTLYSKTHGGRLSFIPIVPRRIRGFSCLPWTFSNHQNELRPCMLPCYSTLCHPSSQHSCLDLPRWLLGNQVSDCLRCFRR